MRTQNIGLSIAEMRLLRQALETLRARVYEQAQQNGGVRLLEARQATFEAIDDLAARIDIAEQRLRRAREAEADKVGAGLPF